MRKHRQVEYALFLLDFNETWICSVAFREKVQISNLIKIRPVAAELFYVDGQTEMTKLTLAFRNFSNAHKNNYFNAKLDMLLNSEDESAWCVISNSEANRPACTVTAHA